MAASRRQFFQAGAIVLAGTAGYVALNDKARNAMLAKLGLSTESASSRLTVLKTTLRNHLEQVFSDIIAAHQGTSLFLDDFILLAHNRIVYELSQQPGYSQEQLPALPPLPEVNQELLDEVVQKFLQSTNVVKVFERNQQFEYPGLFDPYYRPCSNQMSATWM